MSLYHILALSTIHYLREVFCVFRNDEINWAFPLIENSGGDSDLAALRQPDYFGDTITGQL